MITILSYHDEYDDDYNVLMMMNDNNDLMKMIMRKMND